MDSVRLDKWLWAARFFKTRALAIKACDMGRVKLREQPAKPARDIKPGDLLSITNDSATFGIEVFARPTLGSISTPRAGRTSATAATSIACAAVELRPCEVRGLCCGD